MNAELNKEQLTQLREQIIQSSYILRNHPPEPEVDMNCKEMNLTAYGSNISVPAKFVEDSNGKPQSLSIFEKLYGEFSTMISSAIDLVIKDGNADLPTGKDQSDLNNLLGKKDGLFNEFLHKECPDVQETVEANICFGEKELIIFPDYSKEGLTRLSIDRDELNFYLFLRGGYVEYSVACDSYDCTIYYDLGWKHKSITWTYDTIHEDIKKLNEIVATQIADPISHRDEYMRGMSNGLLIAQGVFNGQDPKFIEATEKKSLLNKIFS